MKRYFLILLFTMFIGFLPDCYAREYIVGEGDVLQITVYEHKDLSTIVRVTYEGTVVVPLLGQVKVKDRTVSQIARTISKLLADGYIVEPQVNVFIKEFRSKKATILGQVNNPGIYNLRESTSLLELISQAGGLTKLAGTIAIIKIEESSTAENGNVRTIDLKKLIEKGDTGLNLQINEGNSIYIPKQDVFYVTGEVKKPDVYFYEEGPSVIKAVTMAGGFTAKASKNSVKIIRKISGKEEVLTQVKMDASVLPDDVIVVPESFF